jgi:hypothetical protein
MNQACQTLSSGSRSRGVQVRSVQKSVLLPSAGAKCVPGLSSVSVRPAFLLSACELRQSPREVLAPREVLGLAMQALRRAAEAKKSMRIASRLASLAEGKPERTAWFSPKSIRGVC